eukprot:3551026-Pyramimonas_sp.AAC.1
MRLVDFPVDLHGLSRVLVGRRRAARLPRRRYRAGGAGPDRVVSNAICAAHDAPVMGRPVHWCHVIKREWSPFKLSQELATEEEKGG